MAPSAEREPTVYTLRNSSDKSEETKKRDDPYEGIKDYLGGALTLAPLDVAAPKAILEMGSASVTSSWAIQAAKQFPDAEIRAVNFPPTSQQDLPQNLKFQTVTMTEPFPFQSGTFDVVHARRIMIHLPNFQDVLSRIIKLVKPGGWLLLDDIDSAFYGNPSPGMKSFWEAYQRYMRGKGAEPLAGSAFEGLLKASGAFSEVNAKKLVLPISGKSDDVNLGKLGDFFRTSLSGLSHKLPLEALGITVQGIQEFRAETEDPNSDLDLNLYLTWSRKRLEL